MVKLGSLLFYKDNKVDLSRRLLKPIFDTLSACENIPISLVSYEELDGVVSSLKLEVTSFTSPFLHLLREHKKFSDLEKTLLRSAIVRNSEIGSDIIYNQINFGDVFEGRAIAVVVPLSHMNLALYIGPVWMRDRNSIIQPLDQTFSENVCGNISVFLDHSDDDENGGVKLSIPRIRRLLAHRAPISQDDLKTRTHRILICINALIDGETSTVSLTADIFEELCKSLSFWSSRLSFITSHGIQSCVSSPKVSNFSSPDVFYFTIKSDSDRSAHLVLSIEANSPSSTDHSANTASYPHGEWSAFCDRYRTFRNSYLLERLMLTRLWLQDCFSGVSIKSESGSDKEELFADMAKQIRRVVGADGCVIYRYLPGESPFQSPINSERSQGYLHRIGCNFEFNHLRRPQYTTLSR